MWGWTTSEVKKIGNLIKTFRSETFFNYFRRRSLTETFLLNFLSFLRQKLSILTFFFNSLRSCLRWGLDCESLLILLARCTFVGLRVLEGTLERCHNVGKDLVVWRDYTWIIPLNFLIKNFTCHSDCFDKTNRVLELMNLTIVSRLTILSHKNKLNSGRFLFSYESSASLFILGLIMSFSVWLSFNPFYESGADTSKQVESFKFLISCQPMVCNEWF